MIDTLMQKTPDHRWRIEHAQIMHPSDFQYFNSTGVIPSVQPTHATSDQRWAEHHIGKERLEKGAYAYNTLRSEEHTSELQSRPHLVCRLLLEKKKKHKQ